MESVLTLHVNDLDGGDSACHEGIDLMGVQHVTGADDLSLLTVDYGIYVFIGVAVFSFSSLFL